MAGNLNDIRDANKMEDLFSDISEESKTMVLVYLSALRDKEIADKARYSQEDQNAVLV